MSDMREIVNVDGVAIDADTGEILGDVPGDIPARMEWLALQLSKAKANVKGWTQIETLLKQECERLLVAAGAKSVKTPYGTPTVMLGRETVDVDAVKTLLSVASETGFDEEVAFWRECCNGLNARKVKDWLAPAIGLEETDKLIRRGRDYIQLNPPREQAPPKETR